MVDGVFVEEKNGKRKYYALQVTKQGSLKKPVSTHYSALERLEQI